MTLGAAALLVATLPLFTWLDSARSLPVLLVVFASLGGLVSSFTAVAPTLLSGLFPVAQRATGLSLVYNGAFTLFGGYAPAVLTWLTATPGGSALAPAWYVDFTAVVALSALLFLRGRRITVTPH